MLDWDVKMEDAGRQDVGNDASYISRTHHYYTKYEFLNLYQFAALLDK